MRTILTLFAAVLLGGCASTGYRYVVHEEEHAYTVTHRAGPLRETREQARRDLDGLCPEDRRHAVVVRGRQERSTSSTATP